MRNRACKLLRRINFFLVLVDVWLLLSMNKLASSFPSPTYDMEFTLTKREYLRANWKGVLFPSFLLHSRLQVPTFQKRGCSPGSWLASWRSGP
eukprot:m.67319 g.67319  ORF g.67319 m.67319 type:complete len:93 (-) comp49956_c0_seq3:10-288(-)